MSEAIADFTPLAALPIGRSGHAAGAAGVVVTVLTERAVALVTLLDGGRESVDATCRGAFGVGLPAKGTTEARDGTRAVWLGAAKWLMLRESVAPEAWEADLRTTLGGAVSVVDQSDARLMVRLEGPKVGAMLAKLTGIDLDPRAFRSGSAASTAMAHIGVQIWQVGDAPTYELAGPRTFFAALLEALVEAGAEYGIERTA